MTLIVFTQRLAALVRYGLLYQISARRPQLVLLPMLPLWDLACGSGAWPEDLDTKHFGLKQDSGLLDPEVQEAEVREPEVQEVGV